MLSGLAVLVVAVVPGGICACTATVCPRSVVGRGQPGHSQASGHHAGMAIAVAWHMAVPCAGISRQRHRLCAVRDGAVDVEVTSPSSARRGRCIYSSLCAELSIGNRRRDCICKQELTLHGVVVFHVRVLYQPVCGGAAVPPIVIHDFHPKSIVNTPTHAYVSRRSVIKADRFCRREL